MKLEGASCGAMAQQYHRSISSGFVGAFSRGHSEVVLTSALDGILKNGFRAARAAAALRQYPTNPKAGKRHGSHTAACAAAAGPNVVCNCPGLVGRDRRGFAYTAPRLYFAPGF